MLRNKKIVVVGATGRVGREILSILQKREIPVDNVACIASSNSEGIFLPYCGKAIRVSQISNFDFSGYDVCFCSAGSKISAEYAEMIAANGVLVIDNTSYFRMRDDIPLIVPEVNASDLQKYNSNIIANPNCSTIQMVTALKPLHDLYELSDITVSTYQSVSGAGQNGIIELVNQIHGTDFATKIFPQQIAFNVIPLIGNIEKDGFTTEEWKMHNETRKIFNKEINVIATCVRVPVLICHAISIVATFKKHVHVEQAKCALKRFPSIKLSESLVTPLSVEHSDAVFVSRIRK